MQVAYRFLSFESRLNTGHVVLRFALWKVRCSRTVHGDSDSWLSGFSAVGVTCWLKGGQVVCVVCVIRITRG